MATSKRSNGWSRDACLTDHRTWDDRNRRRDTRADRSQPQAGQVDSTDYIGDRDETHTDHTMAARQPQAALDQGHTLETVHWYDDDRVLTQDRQEYLDCSESKNEVAEDVDEDVDE